MSQNFHVDAGPLLLDVWLDDSGIRMQRGPMIKTIAWVKITGATLVRTNPDDDQSYSAQQEQLIAQFAGQQAVQKMPELQGKVGQIFVACHDDQNRLEKPKSPLRSPIPPSCRNSRHASAIAGSAKPAIAIRSTKNSTPIPAFSKAFSSSWH